MYFITDKDRAENIRRIGHVSTLFLDAGVVVLTAFVSPFRVDRDNIRSLVNKDGHDGEFIEVFCNSSLSRCEERDTKGLYAKARAGIIPDFTGISSPYEPPQSPELTIDTESQSIENCVKQVITYLEMKQMIPNIL
jgi:adenylylsulfate kinase